ncbi:MAG: Gfo/Idh/MocA family oxidoreductase [Pseudomonadota bacterium]
MIRVAILGAGIGSEHLDAYREWASNFTVNRIIDRDMSRAEALRQAGDAWRVSEQVNDALSDDEVDLIDICLPPNLHYETTKAALEAGKHVICEKPFTTSLAQAHEIANQARSSGKLVFPVFQYRWGPAFEILKKLKVKGLLGAPRVASLETHWNRDATYYANGWRGTWAGEQGGAVLCHAIHNHDLLIQAFGPIAQVNAQSATLVNPIETEDCVSVSLRMENGSLATSSITLGAARDETRIRLVYEHLTATSGTEPYAPGLGGWTFQARDPKRQPDVTNLVNAQQDNASGFRGLFTDIHRALTQNTSPSASIEDGIRSVELVAAIYKSCAQKGASVSLPLAQTDPYFESWQP